MSEVPNQKFSRFLNRLARLTQSTVVSVLNRVSLSISRHLLPVVSITGIIPQLSLQVETPRLVLQVMQDHVLAY